MHIYLDSNATTRPDQGVVSAMREALKSTWANPSSVHDDGTRARYAVERARGQVAKAVGCDANEVIFTSGGTESINLALAGAVLALRRARNVGPARQVIFRVPGVTGSAARRTETNEFNVVTTRIEHPATLHTLAVLRNLGLCTVTVVPPRRDGTVSQRAVEAAIRPETALVTVMVANNETGAILPIPGIVAAAHKAGAAVHCDAVQGVGKVRVQAAKWGVDLLSISSHKFHGPKGAGALVVRGMFCTLDKARTKAPEAEGKIALRPVLHGGGQEEGMRPGTLNVPGIVGMGLAAEIATDQISAHAPRLAGYTQWLRETLAKIPGLTFNSPEKACLCNTLNVSLPGITGAEAVRRLADKGIQVSAGSACAAGRGEVSSYVLRAMGRTPEEAGRAIRISLSRDNTKDEMRFALMAIRTVVGV